jgi:hypothetical protein
MLLEEKIKARKNLAFVELLGFEPRQTEPKSVVLPLHHSSIRKECKNKGMAMMYQIFLLPALRCIVPADEGVLLIFYICLF